MTSRNALPLSTLFFIRDKDAITEAEPMVTKSTTTARPLDPTHAKLLALKLKGENPVKKQPSTEIVAKDKTNVVWRQFMISRAAMLTNQR